MEFNDTVFVVRNDTVETCSIESTISYRGIVTGYHLRGHCDAQRVKVSKKDVFTDETAAAKELFVRNLKNKEESERPAEDVRGDRRWIKGHKKRRW